MKNISVLCGGVGGSKLAVGLASCDVSSTVVVNTGDDFSLYGLQICPDIDTVLYSLTGRAHAGQGWGRADESFKVQAELNDLGESIWFQLGDRDIALHLLRANLLSGGVSLSHATQEIGTRFGAPCAIVPMSDSPVPTMVECDAGVISFQEYFVKHRCAPVVSRLHYGGSSASASPEALAALTNPQLDGVVICPSNPVLSIGPILAIESLKNALLGRRVPALAVSPLIAGNAVKGPTRKILIELGIEPTAVEVARLYKGLIDVFVLDEVDEHHANDIKSLGMEVVVAPTLMQTFEDKVRLAKLCVATLERFQASQSVNVSAQE